MFWSNFVIRASLVVAYILLSLAANLLKHAHLIDFSGIEGNKLFFMVHLIILFMVFEVKLLEHMVARCVVSLEGKWFGVILLVLMIGILNALVCWGLMLLWLELSVVIFALTVICYLRVSWCSHARFVHVFLLFQLLSLNYNSYDSGERVSLGIPFIYWLDIISNGKIMYCVLHWDRLVMNQVLLLICFTIVSYALGTMRINMRLLKFGGIGKIVLVAYLIEILLLASHRSFEGRAMDYSCDCYGFPLGFVMNCSYFDKIIFHGRSLMFSIAWHIALFVSLYFAIVSRMHMWIRIILLSMWFYLLYGTTHECETYILGYLGYMEPAIFFSINDLNLNIDFTIVMADFTCTLALLFVCLIGLRSCSRCSE